MIDPIRIGIAGTGFAGRFLVGGRIRVERLGLLRHWGPRRAQARRVLADLIRAICAALAFSIRFANS